MTYSHCHRYRERLLSLLLFVLIMWGTNDTNAADWPNRAIRSGMSLPTPKHFGVSVQLSGAYIPRIGDLSSGKTYVLEPGAVWNFAFTDKLGIFGSHKVSRYRWANVALVFIYNEMGLRYLINDFAWMECAYLEHRLDITWVDGKKFIGNGVRDRGAEVVVGFDKEPIPGVKLSAVLFGRWFRVYNDTHQVLGSKWQLSLSPAKKRAFIVGVELVEVLRTKPRPGVDRFTHNTVGRMEWRSMPWRSVGYFIDAMFSLNSAVGEIPIWELKRSMIDEPMALGTIGLFFEL